MAGLQISEPKTFPDIGQEGYNVVQRIKAEGDKKAMEAMAEIAVEAMAKAYEAGYQRGFIAGAASTQSDSKERT